MLAKLILFIVLLQTHALSLRRAVPGRIKEFDVLLLEHRERVNLAKEQQLLCNAQNVSSNSTGSYGNRFSDQRYFIIPIYSDSCSSYIMTSNLLRIFLKFLL